VGIAQVRIALSQAQLVYDVGLRAPAFDLATNAVKTVQELHKVFADRFKVTPADLSVSNGVRLSEWATRLQMFNGRWLVEFLFDGYQTICNLLAHDADLQLALECIRLGEQVARTVLTSSETGTTLGRLSAWYWCDGGPAVVRPYLSHFAPANLGIVPGFEGAQQALFNIAGSIANTQERWSTRLLIEPSSVEHGHLFIQIEGRYEEGDKYGTLDDKIAHFTKVSQAVLKQADLEVGDVKFEGDR
jgi:hypothetical protein